MRWPCRWFLTGPPLRLVALAGALSLIACAKGPAAEALKTADDAVASAEAEAVKLVPEQFEELQQAARAAHDAFARGDYARAKTAAESVVGDVQKVLKAAAAKKEELAKTWAGLQARVPRMADAIKGKLGDLGAARRLPNGLDKAGLDQANAGLSELEQAWTEASQAAQSGDLAAAADRARVADAKAQDIMKTLGLAPPADASGAGNK
jgi:hypothetical protein